MFRAKTIMIDNSDNWMKFLQEKYSDIKRKKKIAHTSQIFERSEKLPVPPLPSKLQRNALSLMQTVVL